MQRISCGSSYPIPAFRRLMREMGVKVHVPLHSRNVERSASESHLSPSNSWYQYDSSDAFVLILVLKMVKWPRGPHLLAF